MRVLLLSLFITLPLLASAKADSIYDPLNEIKYGIVYPARLPGGFKVARVHADKDKSQPYSDYEIEISGKKGSTCKISTGHELGDNVLISGSTKKKNVKTEIFGEITVWFMTSKEHQQAIEETTGKQNTTIKNLVTTQWVSLLPKHAVGRESVSYDFSCEGVDEKAAIHILTGLAILRK